MAAARNGGMVLCNISGRRRDAQFIQFLDRFDNPLWGPMPDSRGLLVVESRRFDRSMPGSEEPRTSLADSDGYSFRSKAVPATVNPANLRENGVSGPVPAALCPKVGLRHADFLPRYAARGRLQPVLSLVILDGVIAVVSVDKAQMEDGDAAKPILAVLARDVTGTLTAIADHDRTTHARDGRRETNPLPGIVLRGVRGARCCPLRACRGFM